jgi:AcrR family transcriptional regulator
MLLKTSTHKQERALATRRDLISAARAIFAAEGFESARIEQIAASAGKTRGAFYANFSDKEDVFFAIFEEDLMRDQEKIIAAFAAAADLDKRIEILARHIAAMLHDRERILLHLEFKMYVIRHHRRRTRLNAIYAEVRERCAMAKVNRLLPDADAGQRERLTNELGAVIDGLALNVLFNPDLMSQVQIMGVLRASVRGILTVSGMDEKSRVGTKQMQPVP